MSKPTTNPPIDERQGRNWFRDLFGFDEIEYEETQRWLKVEGNMLYSHANEKSYQIGKFDTPSMRELRESVNVPTAVTNSSGLKLSAKISDVQNLLANKINMYATFQVASQFNCLEFISPQYVPEDGITGYVRDRTQGPACSIACGPATTFRNYFASVETIDGEKRIGQVASHQLNNLRDFSKVIGNDEKNPYFFVQNGYSFASAESLDRLNETALQDPLDDEVLSTIRVGVHEDIQVTSSNWGRKDVSALGIIVTQVFSSACAMNYNSGSSIAQWENFARCVLYATYESTLLAAILNARRHNGKHASKTVYLSLVGGGAFGNPLQWIVDAIRRACEKFRNYDLNVVIVDYGSIPQKVNDLINTF